MIANYHTHTHRCHHAYGCEWQYVERAIAGGLKILGFADHTPWPGDATRPGVRMKEHQLAEYIETIETLRRIYGDRIELKIGLEAEYFPDEFEGLMELLKKSGKVEYLILGQHYHTDEKKTPVSKRFWDEETLERWVDNMIEAMHTGKYLYVCHPDVVHFVGLPRIYKKHMKRLCKAAKECNLPLEINGQGLRAGSHYPNRRFWKLAGKMGCKAVIGMDAHRPSGICDEGELAILRGIAEKYGLEILDELEIKELF